jgi:hypothetical protein
MKTKQVVEELKQAAEQLGVRVRTDRGNFRGGRCRIGDEDVIVLNRQHLPEAHLAILAWSLRDLPVDGIFLRPAVRQILEDAWRRNESFETDVADVDE